MSCRSFDAGAGMRSFATLLVQVQVQVQVQVALVKSAAHPTFRFPPA